MDSSDHRLRGGRLRRLVRAHNGDEYRLYNATAPVDADGKRFRTVQLSASSERDFTVQTLKPNFRTASEDMMLRQRVIGREVV